MLIERKILVVLITANFKDDDDMKKHLRAFYIRSNTLIRKFYHSIDIKLILFRSYCTPSYCSHLWVNFNKATYTDIINFVLPTIMYIGVSWAILAEIARTL